MDINDNNNNNSNTVTDDGKENGSQCVFGNELICAIAILVLAICLEVTGTICMKLSDGYKKNIAINTCFCVLYCGVFDGTICFKDNTFINNICSMGRFGYLPCQHFIYDFFQRTPHSWKSVKYPWCSSILGIFELL